MHNIKLIVAYFGSSYVGWQKTKMGASVEETLEQALCKMLQHPVKLQAASRTDAGVHARAQVVNFFTHKTPEHLRYRLNCLLPKDIAILDAVEMPPTFHPTLDATKKHYLYQICHGTIQLPFHRQTSWHFPYPLDIEAMRRAAEHLVGTHDFSCFCNARKLWDRHPVCHLEKIEITPLPKERLHITLTGDHFLFRMARNISGTLAYVGCGKLRAGDIPQILQGKDRTQAGITAPAQGLTLMNVEYLECAQSLKSLVQSDRVQNARWEHGSHHQTSLHPS